MKFLLEFINTLIYFICVKSIGELFLAYKLRKIEYEKLILIFLGIIVAAIILYSNIWLEAIAHVISILIVGGICFRENWRKLLGLYVGSMTVLSMLAKLFNVISTEVIRFLKVKDNHNVARVICLFIILLCIQLIGKYYKEKYETGLKNIDIKYWIFFMMVMLFDSAVVIVIGSFIINTVNVQRRYLAIGSYCCVVIGLLVQLILLINTLVTRNIHKENEELAKQFLESQKEHYKYLEKREYETKKFRHDIKNHLMLVENLITTQKYDEAEEYLKTLNLKILPISSKISVNNGIADAILNRFYMEAEEKGVKLIVKGHFPMTCYITAYDLCTILSNLLSNAIQAEHEAGGKEVLVNIKYTDSNVMLVIENDYIHELNESDGVFKSTKTDDLKHGYGLHNVNECVEKNGGFISISTENCRFKVKVLLVNENGEGL